jgi:arylformamidase
MQLTAEEVERGYNNRAAVPEYPQWFAMYAELSAVTCAKLGPKLDLRYGPGPKETLDLFLPAAPARGTLVFLHGGYWRALDKSDFSFVAEPFVAQGYAYANVNYDLCPDVSVATIVEQTRRAVAWLVREGSAHGANTRRLVVAGHSAGGHLAAMLHATDWQAHGLATSPITGAVSLSGLHDLRPMVLSTLNADLRLDLDSAAAVSPVDLAPTTAAPIVAVCGADETPEFLRQTQMLWDMWPRHRPVSMRGPLFVPARHHFSVVADYHDPASELTQRTLALF